MVAYEAAAQSNRQWLAQQFATLRKQIQDANGRATSATSASRAVLGAWSTEALVSPTTNVWLQRRGALVYGGFRASLIGAKLRSTSSTSTGCTLRPATLMNDVSRPLSISRPSSSIRP